LCVWRGELPAAIVDESRANYDAFYSITRALLTSLIARHGRLVVLDLHSYNHRRDGADAPVANENENPEINLGTASVDRALWGSLIDRFKHELSGQGPGGKKFDVRENVKFFGGHFPRWINAEFPGKACAIAVEFKKTFMDEWTGQRDGEKFAALRAALEATFTGLRAELAKLPPI
jgi:hypothetical protein